MGRVATLSAMIAIHAAAAGKSQTPVYPRSFVVGLSQNKNGTNRRVRFMYSAYPWACRNGITCLVTALLTFMDFARSSALQSGVPLVSLRKLSAAAGGSGGAAWASRRSPALAPLSGFVRFDGIFGTLVSGAAAPFPFSSSGP